MNETILGTNIRRIRKMRGITVQELSKKTGWSRMQISRYEQGVVKSASHSFLTAVANALDVTVEDLEEKKREDV